MNPIMEAVRISEGSLEKVTFNGDYCVTTMPLGLPALTKCGAGKI